MDSRLRGNDGWRRGGLRWGAGGCEGAPHLNLLPLGEEVKGPLSRLTGAASAATGLARSSASRISAHEAVGLAGGAFVGLGG